MEKSPAKSKRLDDDDDDELSILKLGKKKAKKISFTSYNYCLVSA